MPAFDRLDIPASARIAVVATRFNADIVEKLLARLGEWRHGDFTRCIQCRSRVDIRCSV
jgi:6,7-dimethyl-8-ribityllumazine synthase